jgi:hypothetical protein
MIPFPKHIPLAPACSVPPINGGRPSRSFAANIVLNPSNANTHCFYAFTFLMPQNGIHQSPEKLHAAVAGPSFSHREHRLRADIVGGRVMDWELS